MQQHYLIGKQVGNFRIIGILGQGGMADVFLGEHIPSGTQVAIKVLRQHLTGDQREINAFKMEAMRISYLQHSNIVRVIEYGYTPDGNLYIVMEKAEGSLTKFRGQLLHPQTAIHYILQIATALQYAHSQHITHRDLKPDNVLIDQHGTIKLSDFGIAVVSMSINVRTQEIAGTPPYMSPEQFQGHARSASDQYALGIITYELLCGERPFFADNFLGYGYQHTQVIPPNIKSKLPNMPNDIAIVIMRTLEKKIEDRFPSIMDYANTLIAAYKASLQGTTLSPSELYSQKQRREYQKTTEEVLKHIRSGDNLYDMKRYEGAVFEYDAALLLDPQQLEVYKKKGNALSKLHRDEEAIETLDIALRIEPNDAELYNTRGTVLSRMDKYEEALQSYYASLYINPNSLEAHIGRGDMLYELERFEEALQALDTAISINQYRHDIHASRGITLYKLQRFHEAMQACDIALRIFPNDFNAYKYKAFILQEMTRYDEAIDALKKALEIDDTNALIHFHMGNILTKCKLYQDALDAFNRAITFDPNFAKAYHNKAVVLSKLDRRKQAYEAHQKARELDPSLYSGIKGTIVNQLFKWLSKA